MKIFNLVFLCLLVIAMPSFAKDIHAAYPGGIETIIFKTYGLSAPKAYYEGEQVLLQSGANKTYKAVVGIPLSAKLGTHYLKVEFGPNSLELPFDVEQKRYPKQTIKLKTNKHVSLNKEDQARANKESVLVKEVLHSWKNTKQTDLTLVQPISGRYSGKFGLKRIYNGKLKGRHTGLDIAAKKGTPIHAAKPGKVILAKSLFYSGNTVIIDHGQGFKTIYCHMDKLNVKLNQSIDPNAILGFVGSTGRATGPHLHFTVVLNSARVNPLIFFSKKTSKHSKHT